MSVLSEELKYIYKNLVKRSPDVLWKKFTVRNQKTLDLGSSSPMHLPCDNMQITLKL